MDIGGTVAYVMEQLKGIAQVVVEQMEKNREMQERMYALEVKKYELETYKAKSPVYLASRK